LVSDSILYLLLALGAGWLLLEVVEHLLFPLYWVISNKKPRLHHGPATIEGRFAQVVHWEGDNGKVKIDGELWQAKGRENLLKEETVIVKKMDGLTLTVSRPEDKTLKV